MLNQTKIMIIAGEASGDQHGAALVNELKQLVPDLYLCGLGSHNMKHAGVELFANVSDFSVCGFVEVLRYLPRLAKLFKDIKKRLIEQRPDLLILIDYPTFNLRLAKVAAKLNIKVLYYISPQIWAWHTSRIKQIRKNVSMVGVIFPFELDFYRKHAVPVKYVGHPLVGKVSASATKSKLREKYNIPESDIVIGLLPGSRKNEIKYILPTLVEAAFLLQKKNKKIKFILPLANTLTKEEVNAYLLNKNVNIQIVLDHRYDAMSLCDAVVAASGTVTLELALLGIPMVIVYKANSISFCIAKSVVKIPYVGLCNIIAGEKIVEELLQKEATPQNISTALLQIIENDQYREEQKRQLTQVTKKLFAEKECSIGELTFDLIK